MRSRADLAPGIVLLAFGIWVIVESRNISYTNLIGNDPLTPATVPTALGVLLSVLSIGLIVRSLVWRPTTVSTEDSSDPVAEAVPRGRAAQVVLAIVVCVGYAVLLPRLGFVITTPLLVAALIAVAVGRERPVVTALIAIMLPAACYLLFIEALGLDLPVWPGAGPMP
ncbi:MAG: hypothetical protein GEV28_04780 [Actinophytocola sp.]|uniref:tripartite tricarboxylate transporter TctB family protein n=1 Tax=Actinophytocola sp. TaxID=1872138 RepID=UPI00132AF45A|nr:tripartite tricarboxylate transporter TctB family protein [Actinophytocola sp.]MPZ79734.1 hypothetical protein [Actinophytocola sp.]